MRLRPILYCFLLSMLVIPAMAAPQETVDPSDDEPERARSSFDEFAHQAYVDNPAFKFETAESDPGNAIGIKVIESGTFDVFCHIPSRGGLGGT